MITAVVLVVVAGIVFFALLEYKDSMYQQLFRRSMNTVQFISDRFQNNLWTKTGKLRGVRTKHLTSENELPGELQYIVQKIFDDVIENDPSVSYFIFYSRAGNLSYPGVPLAKNKTLRKDAAAVRRVENIGARYNEESGHIEIFKTLLDKENNPWAWLEMGVNPEVVRKGIRRTIWSSMGIALICSIAGLGAAFWFGNNLLIPVLRLRRTAQAITEGDLTQRAAVTTRDEIADLSESFNTMADRLESRIQDLRSVQMLSTQISTQLNQDGLLHVVAQTFGNIARADFSAILKRDDAKPSFTISTGVGVTDTSVSINDADPFVARIMRENLEICTTIGQAGEIGRMFYRGNPDTPSDGRALPEAASDADPLAVLPLIVDGKIFSLIVLGGKSLRVEPDDFALYRTLVSHACVALHNAKLYQLAITDGLTGLYLRRHFLYELGNLMNPPADEGRIALLMSDIDHFKRINDTYGHPEGDFILINISQTIRKTLRTYDVRRAERIPDIVGRYGGEEFIALLRNVNPEQARAAGERLRQGIEKQVYRSEKHEHRITSSVGICPYRPGITMEEWIDLADKALYRSKQEGRNRVTMHEFSA